MDQLVLNGDIIETWHQESKLPPLDLPALRKREDLLTFAERVRAVLAAEVSSWRRDVLVVVQCSLCMQIRVVYVMGNHDNLLSVDDIHELFDDAKSGRKIVVRRVVGSFRSCETNPVRCRLSLSATGRCRAMKPAL